MLSQDSANERSSLVKRSSSSPLRALTSGASSDKQVLSSQVLSFLSAKSLVFGSIDGVITGLTVFSSLQQITTSSRTIIAVVVGCCLADAISICIGQVLSQRQLEEEVKILADQCEKKDEKLREQTLKHDKAFHASRMQQVSTGAPV